MIFFCLFVGRPRTPRPAQAWHEHAFRPLSQGGISKACYFGLSRSPPPPPPLSPLLCNHKQALSEALSVSQDRFVVTNLFHGSVEVVLYVIPSYEVGAPTSGMIVQELSNQLGNCVCVCVCMCVCYSIWKFPLECLAHTKPFIQLLRPPNLCSNLHWPILFLTQSNPHHTAWNFATTCNGVSMANVVILSICMSLWVQHKNQLDTHHRRKRHG